MSDDREFYPGHDYDDALAPWAAHEEVHADLITRQGFYRSMTVPIPPPPRIQIPVFPRIEAPFFAPGDDICPPEPAIQCMTFELERANPEVGTALYREV